MLEERLKESGKEISDEFKQTLLSIFSQQENFSKVRNVDKASVKLRFRIMTEVKAEGNILNKAKIVFSKTGLEQFNIFKIKHHFNGYFLVLQVSL